MPARYSKRQVEMALAIRIVAIDDHGNEQVSEIELEPGAQLSVPVGAKVEIVDSDGRPIELIADGDDVVVTIPAERLPIVVIDGISHDGSTQEETYTFENLALYIEDETGSSITYVDPETDEVIEIASIEDLLAGISTAASNDVQIQSTFGASGGEADPNDPSFGDPLGVPAQDAPASNRSRRRREAQPLRPQSP